MNVILSRIFERYVAADLHKNYVVVGGVNIRREVVLPPRRIELKDWPRWAERHLTKADALVVESTSNAWDFYDQVEPLVGRAVVANPRLVKAIASSRVKTDKVDTLALARLLAANLVPEVWVPPLVVREARGLLAHRRRLVKEPHHCHWPVAQPPAASQPARPLQRRQSRLVGGLGGLTD